MSILDSISKKRYLVDDNKLERVLTLSKKDLYQATPHYHHKFERMIDAQKYRLASLYNHYKARSNKGLAIECLNRLKNIEADHPEWLI